jgi:hypothetical protein
MPPKKKSKKSAPKKSASKKKSKPKDKEIIKGKKKPKMADIPMEKEKLQARLSVLLVECEDFWSGKRGKHSHVNPIFTEYWRLVDLARDLYPKNTIFNELDIHDVTQPNADDIQALEMDVRKMLAVFEIEDIYEEC